MRAVLTPSTRTSCVLPMSAALTFAASSLNAAMHSSSRRRFSSGGTSSCSRWAAWVFCVRERERERETRLTVWISLQKKKKKNTRPTDPKPATAHLPHAVGKQESHIVAHRSDERQRLLVVVLRLATEAGDEVTAEAHV